MTGLTVLNQNDNTEPEVTSTTEARPVVTPMASKGRFATATPTGPIALAPGILENMQRVLEEKEARKSSFAEGLKDVSAWFPGYQGNVSQSLATRAKTREDEIGDIFQMRNQIAQFKAAQQKQAEFEARRARQLGTGQQGTQVGGMYIPEHVRVALDNAPTQEAHDKIFNEFAIKYNTNSTMFTPTVPVVAIGPDGQPYRKVVSVDEYRRNQHLYEDTPQTQKAITTATGGASTTSTTPAAAPTGGAQPPVSVRNNNPGNLVDSKTGKIRVFDTPEEGEAALDADVEGKLSGKSEAYKQRFGEQPVTPARLAETWAPAKAPGNSAESTTNYGNVIAKELGIGPNDTIPNTPEAIEAVKRAITRFEAGTPATAPVTTAAPTTTTTTAAPTTTATTTAAPTTTATTTVVPTRRPTPGQMEKQEDREKETFKANLAIDQKSAEKFLENTDPLSLRNREIQNVGLETWIKKWGNNDRIIGLLNQPTLTNAILTVLDEGIKTPNGQISIGGIEDALQKLIPGVRGAEVEARQELQQILGARILDVVQRTKGSSSDKDWNAYKIIAGSTKNGIDLINKLQKYDKLSIDMDKKQRRLFDDMPDKSRTYTEFQRNAEKRRMDDEVADSVYKIARSEYLRKRAPARPQNVPEGAKYSPSTNSWWFNGKKVG